VVQDHAAPRRLDDAQQVIDRAVDRGGAHLALDVGRRARQVQRRRPLLDEPGGGDRRQRPLHVGGEHEPLVLAIVHHREGHHVAERGALEAVRQRRRDA
jgi:hypothetical protein